MEGNEYPEIIEPAAACSSKHDGREGCVPNRNKKVLINYSLDVALRRADMYPLWALMKRRH